MNNVIDVNKEFKALEVRINLGTLNNKLTDADRKKYLIILSECLSDECKQEIKVLFFLKKLPISLLWSKILMNRSQNLCNGIMKSLNPQGFYLFLFVLSAVVENNEEYALFLSRRNFNDCCYNEIVTSLISIYNSGNLRIYRSLNES